MILLARLIRARRGSAAVELALVFPILLAIVLGSVEMGNFFYNQHTLTKAVRDGARYAARQPFSTYSGCNGSAANIPTAGTANTPFENTKLIVQKALLTSSAQDTLLNWSGVTANCATSTTGCFQATMTCVTTMGGQTPGGIYTGNSVGTVNAAPVVTVTASLPYKPIVETLFGFSGKGYFLNASQQAAVAGL